LSGFYIPEVNWSIELFPTINRRMLPPTRRPDGVIVVFIEPQYVIDVTYNWGMRVRQPDDVLAETAEQLSVINGFRQSIIETVKRLGTK